MKSKFLNVCLVAGALSMMHACDLDYEILNPVDLTQTGKTAEYYENLRNWKKSDHEVTFGWYGNWTGGGASLENSMMGLPDSVDFVSIWGNWQNPGEDRLNDLRQVRALKGTRAMVCCLVMDCGDGVTPPMTKEQEEKYGKDWKAYRHDFWGWGETLEEKVAASKKYANAILDTIAKYDYDGFDIDAEPNYAQPFATDYEMWRHDPAIMDAFVETLAAKLGPKSGTDKLFVVDGEPYEINPKYADCFNYYILQAYGNDSHSSLNSKIGRTVNAFKDVMPVEEITKKIIVCENFENWASSGGVNYILPNGEVVPSLIGFALWEPVLNGKQYRKGGVGSFHMEYEYNPGKPVSYPALRQAIQIMNPSVK